MIYEPMGHTLTTHQREKILRPQMRYFKKSDEISTLKANVVKCLDKEICDKSLKFRTRGYTQKFDQKISETYNQVFNLGSTYDLETSTYCLFDKVFRNFIARNFKSFLEFDDEFKNVGDLTPTDFQNFGGESEKIAKNIQDTFDLKLKLAKVSALICLRLVMKYQDNQQDLVTPSIMKSSSASTEGSAKAAQESDTLISSYQHVLDKIVDNIMILRNLIWGPNFGLGNLKLDSSQRSQIILELTNSFIQTQEYEICIANNWNLNQGSGAEILSYILKMSNNSYDFTAIKAKVNNSAIKDMFQPFVLDAPRQSSVFLAHLRHECEQLKYHEFHNELLEFIGYEQIEELIDQDQVMSVYSCLQQDKIQLQEVQEKTNSLSDFGALKIELCKKDENQFEILSPIFKMREVHSLQLDTAANSPDGDQCFPQMDIRSKAIKKQAKLLQKSVLVKKGKQVLSIQKRSGKSSH